MDVDFTNTGWEEFCSWLDEEPRVALKIRALIADIRRTPFKGLGKPEPLKYRKKGLWSRRITDEHRLIYRISGTRGVDQKCRVYKCKHHYK